MDKIIPIWKEIGQSTHKITQVMADKYSVKAAHTGILDPIAQGVIIILLDEARFNKDKYTQTEKEYVVEILLGASTDTHDLLGMVSRFQPVDNKHECKMMTAFLDKYTQIDKQAPHTFSSRKREGKFSYLLAKEGDLASPSPRNVKLHEFKLIEFDYINRKELLEKLNHDIPRVEGIFRQVTILDKWNLIEQYLPQTFPRLRVLLKTSAGFYVRSLIRDFELTTNIPALSYDLTRTKNAGYAKKDCISITNKVGDLI